MNRTNNVGVGKWAPENEKGNLDMQKVSLRAKGLFGLWGIPACLLASSTNRAALANG